jgi:hypothetical protein
LITATEGCPIYDDRQFQSSKREPSERAKGNKYIFAPEALRATPSKLVNGFRSVKSVKTTGEIQMIAKRAVPGWVMEAATSGPCRRKDQGSGDPNLREAENLCGKALSQLGGSIILTGSNTLRDWKDRRAWERISWDEALRTIAERSERPLSRTA